MLSYEMVCYVMLCYDICMLSYAMVYVVKDKYRATGLTYVKDALYDKFWEQHFLLFMKYS